MLYIAGVTVRSLGRITAANSYFFLCDMQEKFVPSIKYFPAITTVASKMVSEIQISKFRIFVYFSIALITEMLFVDL